MTQESLNHIKAVLNKIEEELNWGPSSNWKQRDYEALSELIFEKTNVQLSLSTLKRLWKQEFKQLPQSDTLNGLVAFIGYKNWQSFVADQKTTHVNPTSKPKSARRFIIPVIVVILVLGYFLLMNIKNPLQNVDKNQITFSARSITDAVPNTMVFNYSVPGLESDSLYIQQSWDWRRREKVSSNDSIHTSVYYYPGYFNSKLIYQDSILKEYPIHIYTDGWQGLTTETGRDEIPTYIPKENTYSDGMLYISPETLKNYNVDLKTVSQVIHFFYSKPFEGLDCGNFVFETRIKNALEDGALTCQTAYVSLHFENGRTRIPLTMDGCIGDLSLVYNDYFQSGKKSDLSAFGTNMNEWQNLKIEAKENQVNIFLNGNKIKTLKYKHDSGDLKYIQYRFLGCGQVDFLQLSDTTGKTHYIDNF